MAGSPADDKLGRAGARVAALFADSADRASWVLQRILAPLRVGDGPNKFNLSAVETATTTYNWDEGWAQRPPAVLECPRCGSDIVQYHAHDSIDCTRCVAQFPYEEFADLELRYMGCPQCKQQMIHGQRHPDQFDFPEWATCDDCRYHWEFKHAY